MNYRIDNLQYCNWSRKIFEINREAQLDAVHVTLVYWENTEDSFKKIEEWQQKSKNCVHLEKALKYLMGDLMNVSSSEELVKLIQEISNLVQSSDKILVTMKKLEKWMPTCP